MTRQRRAAVAALALVAAAACDVAPSPAPTSTPGPARPSVAIDQTWTAQDGAWTFTGRVDPMLDPTDVVLEIGPGPQTLRQFDTTVPVEVDLLDAGPVSVTTSELPDIDEICVRFKATNSAGSTVSQPLCIPHDLPSIVPPTGTPGPS